MSSSRWLFPNQAIGSGLQQASHAGQPEYVDTKDENGLGDGYDVLPIPDQPKLKYG